MDLSLTPLKLEDSTCSAKVISQIFFPYAPPKFWRLEKGQCWDGKFHQMLVSGGWSQNPWCEMNGIRLLMIHHPLQLWRLDTDSSRTLWKRALKDCWQVLTNLQCHHHHIEDVKLACEFKRQVNLKLLELSEVDTSLSVLWCANVWGYLSNGGVMSMQINVTLLQSASFASKWNPILRTICNIQYIGRLVLALLRHFSSVWCVCVCKFWHTCMSGSTRFRYFASMVPSTFTDVLMRRIHDDLMIHGNSSRPFSLGKPLDSQDSLLVPWTAVLGLLKALPEGLVKMIFGFGKREHIIYIRIYMLYIRICGSLQHFKKKPKSMSISMKW